MKPIIKLLIASSVAMVAFGCATAPEVLYLTEAKEVTTQALEPVSLDPLQLRSDITQKWSRQLGEDMTDPILKTVSEQIARTKRFTKVIENTIDGENYIIVPAIDDLKDYETKIPTDPTRKKVTFKAKVRLDVKFMNQKGQVELVKSYSDLRTDEIKVSAKDPVDATKKAAQYAEVIEVGFKAAANLLGAAFNPSYEMGTISRINGKTVNVQINTTKLKKMPKKQQVVEVVDAKDNNTVLASISELILDNGNLTGKLYEKSGVSIKEGSKVRAKVNGLTD